MQDAGIQDAKIQDSYVLDCKLYPVSCILHLVSRLNLSPVVVVSPDQ
jgi:hypothetical protein